LIESLIEKSPPNSVVLSFDEKGKTSIKQYGGKKWTVKKIIGCRIIKKWRYW
jgi:hypothetical protein